MEVAKTKDLLVGLITKNNSKHIAKVLKNVQGYSSHFKSNKVVIIDGHSTDGTYEICKMWCKIQPESRRVYRQPSLNLPRPLSLGEARNMYISIFQEDFKKDTYLLLLDCDEVNCMPLDEEGFLSNFKYPTEEWDAMFANQTKEYYDIYALRSDECPENYQDVLRKTGDEWSALRRHQVPKQRDHPLISVRSAFGGLGLYHTEKLKGCWYSSFIGSPFDGKGCKEVCEHVPFHESFVSKGARLFINPNFINM